MGTEGYHGDRGVPWGQMGTMGTEGYHEDRRVPWGQRVPYMYMYRGDTEVPYHGDRGVPWGQRGTLPWGQRVHWTLLTPLGTLQMPRG